MIYLYYIAVIVLTFILVQFWITGKDSGNLNDGLSRFTLVMSVVGYIDYVN